MEQVKHWDEGEGLERSRRSGPSLPGSLRGTAGRACAGLGPRRPARRGLP